eukprot:TRINITY_DN20611_c0_g1_i1.p1 TRINITY_DN20611_c0_g1~~TRINITY_DN20611_c0_g1_i1.p1  ORF type:complete len:178 (+),score=24.49 TRINITY_DN20611_c0_g1_i1:362-895(+)
MKPVRCASLPADLGTLVKMSDVLKDGAGQTMTDTLSHSLMMSDTSGSTDDEVEAVISYRPRTSVEADSEVASEASSMPPHMSAVKSYSAPLAPRLSDFDDESDDELPEGSMFFQPLSVKMPDNDRLTPDYLETVRSTWHQPSSSPTPIIAPKHLQPCIRTGGVSKNRRISFADDSDL